MAPTPLQAQQIGLTQVEPPEGRKAIPLTANFITGAENFSFSTASLGASQPSSIISMWIDATALPPAVSVNINTGLQNIVVQGGTQKYIIVTSQTPFQVNITCSGAATGAVPIILYNYNVDFTGIFTQPKQAAPTGSGFSGTVPVPVKTPGSHGASI